MKPSPPQRLEPLDRTDTAEGRAERPLHPGRPVGSCQLRYEILCEHGAGGIGRVLRAHDRQLDRTVAIKELQRTTHTASTRFIREAVITAKLQHPGIVPVHESGTWPDGRPFYAMKLVDGESLRDKLDACRDLRERLAYVPSLLAVADAVAYAHSEGVIHRDLKPSNVIVGEYGETVVIDWGLAKFVDDVSDEAPGRAPYRSLASAALTSTGSVLGTPGYMAPEQARGETVDARADVYALGAMLYCLLCGRRPFAGRTPDDSLRELLTSGPAPIRELAPGAPVELEAIAQKAMSPDPGARYPSASELAADLREFEAGRIVRAHDYTLADLVRRWISRRKAVVATILVAACALAVTVILSVERVATERDHATEQRNRLTLLHARESLRTDPTQSLAWLKTYQGSDELEALAIAADAGSRRVARHVLAAHLDGISHIAAVPGAAAFYTASRDHTLRRWTVPAGKDPTYDIVATDLPEATIVAVSPGEDRLAFETIDRELVLLDTRTAERHVLVRHHQSTTTLAFSGDGTHLVALDAAGTLRVWRVDHPGEETLTRRNVRSAHFSRDGDSLVLVEGGSLIRVALDAPASESQPLLPEAGIDVLVSSENGDQLAAASPGALLVLTHSGEVATRLPTELRGSLAISNDARFIALCSANAVRSWSVDSRERVLDERVQRGTGCAFSPDSQYLVFGDRSVVEVRALQRSEPTATLTGHRSMISAPMVFLPGGLLVSGDSTGELRLWNTGASPAATILPTRGDEVRTLASCADRYLASDTDSGWAHVWDVKTMTEVAALPVPGGLFGLAFTPNCEQLLAGALDGQVWAWSLASKQAREVHRHRGMVRHIVSSPDGSLVASGGQDGRILVSQDGRSTLSFEGHTGDIYWLAFSPDSRRLASASADGTIRVWSLDDNATAVLRGHESVVFRLMFLDEHRVMSAGWDGTVRLWDLSSRSSRTLLRAHTGIRHLELNPRRTEAYAVSDGGTTWIIDLQTYEKRRLPGHDARIVDVAVSPASRYIATGSHDTTVRVWSHSGDRLAVLRGHSAPLQNVVFVGDRLASAALDGTVRVWPSVDRGAVSAADLSDWLKAHTSAIISASGRLATPVHDTSQPTHRSTTRATPTPTGVRPKATPEGDDQ